MRKCVTPNKGLTRNHSWSYTSIVHAKRLPSSRQLLSLREGTIGAAMGEIKRLECVGSRQERFKKERTIAAVRGQVNIRTWVVFGFGSNWSLDGHC